MIHQIGNLIIIQTLRADEMTQSVSKLPFKSDHLMSISQNQHGGRSALARRISLLTSKHGQLNVDAHTHTNKDEQI